MYLGPSKNIDHFDIEYLNGEIEETEKEVMDSYRYLSKEASNTILGGYAANLHIVIHIL